MPRKNTESGNEIAQRKPQFLYWKCFEKTCELWFILCSFKWSRNLKKVQHFLHFIKRRNLLEVKHVHSWQILCGLTFWVSRIYIYIYGGSVTAAVRGPSDIHRTDGRQMWKGQQVLAAPLINQYSLWRICDIQPYRVLGKEIMEMSRDLILYVLYYI